MRLLEIHLVLNRLLMRVFLLHLLLLQVLVHLVLHLWLVYHLLLIGHRLRLSEVLMVWNHSLNLLLVLLLTNLSHLDLTVHLVLGHRVRHLVVQFLEIGSFWVLDSLTLLGHLSRRLGSCVKSLIICVAWRIDNAELVILNKTERGLRLLALRVHELLRLLAELVVRLLVKLNWNVLGAFNCSVWKFLAIKLDWLMNIFGLLLSLSIHFRLSLILWVLELTHFQLILLQLFLNLLHTVLLKRHSVDSNWSRWRNLLLLLLRSFINIGSTTLHWGQVRNYSHWWVMRTHSFIVLQLLASSYIHRHLLNSLSPVSGSLRIVLKHLLPLLISLHLILLHLWLEVSVFFL